MAIEITVKGGEMSEQEKEAYVQHGFEKYGKRPQALTIEIDGDYVNLDYDYGVVPFERIRRITGYLVGTLDRFNNGKRAEERERVKHGLSKQIGKE